MPELTASAFGQDKLAEELFELLGGGHCRDPMPPPRAQKPGAQHRPTWGQVDDKVHDSCRRRRGRLQRHPSGQTVDPAQPGQSHGLLAAIGHLWDASP